MAQGNNVTYNGIELEIGWQLGALEQGSKEAVSAFSAVETAVKSLQSSTDKLLKDLKAINQALGRNLIAKAIDKTKIGGATGDAVSAIDNGAMDGIESGTNAMRDDMGETAKYASRVSESLGKTKGEADKVNDSLKKTNSLLSKLMKKAENVAFYRTLRVAIKNIANAVKEGMVNLREWSALNDGKLSTSMSRMEDNLLKMKNALATALAPVLGGVIIPLITWFANAVIMASNAISHFFASIKGSDKYLKAMDVSATKTATSTSKLKNSLLGFDELNVLNDDSSAGASTGVADMFGTEDVGELSNFESAMKSIIEKVQGFMEKFKEKTAGMGLTFKDVADVIDANIGKFITGAGALMLLGGLLLHNIPLAIAGGAIVGLGIAIGNETGEWSKLFDDVCRVISDNAGKIIFGAGLLLMLAGLIGCNVPLAIVGAGISGIGIALDASGNSWGDLANNIVSMIDTITPYIITGIGLGIALFSALKGNVLGVVAGCVIAGVGITAVDRNDKFSDMIKNLKTALNGAKSWFEKTILPLFTKAFWDEKWRNVKLSWTTGLNNLKESIRQVLESIKQAFRNFYNSTLSSAKSNFGLSENILSADAYASGGTPSTGSLFIAGEQGAELVSSSGGTTTVTNRDQLAESVASGNEGVIDALNTLISVIQRQNTTVTISANDIRKAVNTSSMRLGV